MRRFANQHSQKHICQIIGILLAVLLVGSLLATLVYAKAEDHQLQAIEAGASLPLQSPSVESLSNITDWFTLTYQLNHPTADQSGYREARHNYLQTTDLSKPAKAIEKIRIALLFSAIAPVEEDAFIQESLSLATGSGNIMNTIFGLILADSRQYPCANRETLIQSLVKSQAENGGWGLMPGSSDVDVTSMALQALAPHKANADVQVTVTKALSFLRSVRQSSGGFASYGNENAESTCQVILALCALGEDPTTFFNDGHPNPLDVLETFAVESGHYAHVIGGGANALATYQVYQALTAYRLLTVNGQRMYDFSSVIPLKDSTETSTETSVETELSTEKETTVETEISTEKEQSTEKETLIETESDKPSETQTETSKETISETVEIESRAPEIETESSALPVESSSSVETERTPDESDSNESEPTGESSPSPTKPEGTVPPWKWIAAGVLMTLGAAAVIGLLLSHQLTKWRLIPILVIVIGLLVVVFGFIHIESVEDHFQVETSTESTQSSVTIEILCYNALQHEDVASSLPSDGVILKRVSVPLNEGMTAWDVLDRVTRANHILTTHRGQNASVYVDSIAGLYEMDCGSLSGWIYVVNGQQLSVGCGAYTCQDGDLIQWVYTCDLGNDVQEGPSSFAP